MACVMDVTELQLIIAINHICSENRNGIALFLNSSVCVILCISITDMSERIRKSVFSIKHILKYHTKKLCSVKYINILDTCICTIRYIILTSNKVLTQVTHILTLTFTFTGVDTGATILATIIPTYSCEKGCNNKMLLNR